MSKHVCPWYLGYFLINPFRKFLHDPETILIPYLKTGMRVLEIGPGMGYFSLPIAKLISETGRLFAVDIQAKMLKRLKRRCEKANFIDRIEIRLCDESSLKIEDLADSIDFVLAFAVVHEISDHKNLFEQISKVLKKDGLLLISEPKGHVTKEEFEITLSTARSCGMKETASKVIKKSHSSILRKI